MTRVKSGLRNRFSFARISCLFEAAREAMAEWSVVLGGILVVDDHPVIAKACSHVFESIGIEKIVSAGDADSGFKAFVDYQPDVSIVDLSFRRAKLDGIGLIRRIRSHDGSARILVFSMLADRKSFLSAIEAGAMSYVIKDSPVEEFAKAIQRTRSGHRYIDPQLALNLAFPRNATLSIREQEILDMLLDENMLRAAKRMLQS